MAEKTFVNMREPKDALAWLEAFKARIRAEKKQDIDADPTATPPIAQDFQIADQFLYRCGVECLKKVQSLAAPKKVSELKFQNIEDILRKYLEPQQRLTIAEQSKFMQQVQPKDESNSDYLASLREMAKHCEFGKLRTVADTEEYMVRLRFIAGLADVEDKMKVLEQLQLNENLTADEILQFLQRRRQTLKFLEEKPQVASMVNFGKFRQREQRTRDTKSQQCGKCGRLHPPKQCPAWGKKCKKCNKLNHFAAQCTNKLVNYTSENQGSSKDEGGRSDDERSQESDYSFFMIPYAFNTMTSRIESAKVNGIKINMLKDTGASLTVISKDIWNQIGQPTLSESESKCVETYDKHTMNVLGAFSGEITWRKNKYPVRISVVDTDRDFGLLGTDVLDQVKGEAYHAEPVLKQKLSAVKGVTASVKLIEGAEPRVVSARRVPLHMEEKVNTTLDELQDLGILEPVDPGGVTNASPVVWVKRSGGRLRMCADYKVHVNAKIKTEDYPIPPIETIFGKTSGAKFFAKIDLSNAYWQITLDKESQEICTVNTTKGMFRVTRLQQGLKNASAIFQRTIEQVLKGLKGKVCYQDDILVFGTTDAELKKNYNAIVERLKGRGFTINEEKCTQFSRSLTFLGYEISEEGIKPDPKHVQKLRDMLPPNSKKEVEQFVGLVTYFGRMIPKYAEKLKPINALRAKNVQFNWTPECQSAFDNLVKELSSNPVIKPYDLNKEASLTTDASEKTIGGVLTQEGHPVIYVSRTLNDSEKNYSNIEREALAVVFCVTRLKQFLSGRHFTIITDHKPLQFIYHPAKEIPKVASARIARWAIQLMAFDFDIKHEAGSNISHADAMSRLRFKTDDIVFYGEQVNQPRFEKPTISISKIKTEIENNLLLQSIASRVRSGKWNNCSKAEAKFSKYKEHLTIEEGILYKDNLPYIPPVYQKQVLDKIHEVHSGVAAMQELVKKSAWWPGITNDVKLFVQKCAECTLKKPRIVDNTHKWKDCDPWERLHMDWLYSSTHGEVLIIADAGSGWLEAFQCKDRASSTVIECLREIFSRFGVPTLLVSDNAKEFVSVQLSHWLQSQGCTQMHSPPYSPRSNGLAERAVQTIKNAIKFYDPSMGCTFKNYLQRLLMHHRNSSTAKGQTPAMKLMKRSIRVPVVSQFATGDKVVYQPSENHPPKEATYIMRKGNNTSWLQNEDKAVLASDAQIAPIYIKEEPESDNEDPVQDQSTTEAKHESSVHEDSSSQEAEQQPSIAPDQRPKRHTKTVQKYQAGYA